jgi:DNA-binding NtrC family response regulator
MTNNGTVLIIEDDHEQKKRYKSIVEKLSYEVVTINNVTEAKNALKTLSIDFALIDIHLSPPNQMNIAEGIELIAYVKANYPEIIPIAMSNDPKIETYKRAMDAGATHFVKKPIVNEDELAIDIENARAKFSLQKVSNLVFKTKTFPSHLAAKVPDGIVLSDELRLKAKKIATGKTLPVVIYGETGTGKEEFAKLIHRRRCETQGAIPFVSVNCGNLDDNMAASLLFGHLKGSFTGATTTTSGYIGEANGGILFLDEIHYLSKTLQQRLLRVLNDGTYERLGDTKKLRSTFQVITASTKDLDEQVDVGNFLLDLRTRLIGRDIFLPPLRERKEDIPALISLFVSQDNVEMKPEDLTKLAQKCAGYYWQGNIRLLQRAIQTLLADTILCGETFNLDALPLWRTMLAPSSSQASAQTLPGSLVEKILGPLQDPCDIETAVELYEKTILERALTKHEKLSDAASALGISRASLDGKRKKHGIL